MTYLEDLTELTKNKLGATIYFPGGLENILFKKSHNFCVFKLYHKFKCI